MIDKLKDLMIVLTIFLVVLAGLTALLVWLVGLTGLIIGLSVTVTVFLLVGAFVAGSYWTRASMESGARLAIESANSNDLNDANKLESLSSLAREMTKAYAQMPKSLPMLPQPNSYPALPPFNAPVIEIEGLESEELDHD